MVQGSVPALRQLKFRKRLTEGSIYTLSGFDVTRSNPKFRLSGAPFSLRFNDGTDFEKLKTTVRTIPTEQFRFRPYDQLLELANTGKQLPGICASNLEISVLVIVSCFNTPFWCLEWLKLIVTLVLCLWNLIESVMIFQDCILTILWVMRWLVMLLRSMC